MKKVGFWVNQFSERGTEIAVYDYAFHNQRILKNKSYIFYDPKNNPEIYVEKVFQKFKNEFEIFSITNNEELDKWIDFLGIKYFYNLKYGTNDKRLSTIAKNIVHCVFDCKEPHGDVYGAISKHIFNYDSKYPIVPHMISLPDVSGDLRNKLDIPSDALVFGRYGAYDLFNLPSMDKVVYYFAKENPDTFFLFANTKVFCPELPNIIHLEKIIDLEQKVRFINTCNAMLWAGALGETFGLSLGEFSVRNKPVIACKIGFQAHAEFFAEKGIWYKSPKHAHEILKNFKEIFDEKNKELNGDWNCFKDFTPEKVMEKFNNYFLCN